MKKILITGAISALSLIALGGIAFADTMMSGAMHSTTMPSSVMMMHSPAPMILTVSTNGHGLLRGVVQSVSTSSITVAAWGGIWTVNVTGDTNIVSGTLSSIVVGDYIGASGMVSENGPIMTADIVRDRTKHASAMMHGDSMMQSTTSSALMH